MTTTTQFHSEYEIVKWLASRENFDQGLAELRAALAEDRIVNGRGLVNKWLSVYDDVTVGRVVEHRPAEDDAEPVPPSHVERQPTASQIEDSVVLARMVQETRLWAEASSEAAARADARCDLLEQQTRKTARPGFVGVLLALLALVGLALLTVLLWPQIEPRWIEFVRPIGS
ncbi:MAG: hypothetical protein ABI589_12275 [Burkholderiales bacterium]